MMSTTICALVLLLTISHGIASTATAEPTPGPTDGSTSGDYPCVYVDPEDGSVSVVENCWGTG